MPHDFELPPAIAPTAQRAALKECVSDHKGATAGNLQPYRFFHLDLLLMETASKLLNITKPNKAMKPTHKSKWPPCAKLRIRENNRACDISNRSSDKTASIQATLERNLEIQKGEN